MNSESRCQRALEAIARDESLNAWCFIDRDAALQAARESDRRHEQSAGLGPLDGKLIALKSNIAVQAWPWDAGLARLRSRIAPQDAPIVKALREAGAVLLGLTRMDEAALGATGMSIEGPIRLPGSPGLSPGGSSGGAAVAVAAGHCDAAIGTDTIGSVRIPAALCGLFGFKPRRHSLSLQGIEPLHPQHDQPGPIAADIDTLRHVWQVISTRRATLKAVDADTPRRWGLLALPAQTLQSLPRSTVARYLDTLQHAVRQGLPVHECERPQDRLTLSQCIELLAPARKALFILCEQALARHWQVTAQEPLEGCSTPLKEMLHYGAALGSEKEADLKRTLQQFTSQWQECSLALQSRHDEKLIWALPTTPVSSFAHGAGPPDNIADWTALASITGWPALTLPTQNLPTQNLPAQKRKQDSDAVVRTSTPEAHAPFGLQLVAPELDNDALCDVGRVVSRHLLAGGDPDALSPTDV